MLPSAVKSRSVDLPFLDRATAGIPLSTELSVYRSRPDVVVLGLPRGGVPVAKTVAAELDVSLEFLAVRKVRFAGHATPIGAIAEGGVEIWNMHRFRGLQPDHAVVSRALARAREELEALGQLYHGDHIPIDLTERCVIIVDDGLETGISMRAAINNVRGRGAAFVIVAIPAAPREAVKTIRTECDEVICLSMPEPFHDLSQYYLDYAYPSFC